MGRTGCHCKHTHTHTQCSVGSVFTRCDLFELPSHRHVQQQLPSRPVQDLHQVPDALLPDVKRVLPRRSRHDVLAVAREAAALPRRPAGQRETSAHTHTRAEPDPSRPGRHLFTRSCSFCMGSGSPSLPQVRISRPSYTRMIRSAVLMRKQLRDEDTMTSGSLSMTGYANLFK